MIEIDPQQWIDGFRDAYQGEPSQMLEGDDHSYASGRVEGDALRMMHKQAWGLASQGRDPDGTAGFDHGYRGSRAQGQSMVYQEAFTEGTALRAEHEAELEQALFNGHGKRWLD